MNFPELFTGDNLLELCNSFWKSSLNGRRNVQPYLRGCKWSPDGTCCLSVVNSDGIHIMELPQDLYGECPNRERMISFLPAVVHVKEGGLVYDFCWYPKMNSYNPETCSWITTKKNSPIQLWDAFNGSLRCSYRGYNSVDEMEPALSVMFISDGLRVVGGYRNCLRTFDVDRPGRDFIEHKIKSTASCITTKDRLLAVGSWDTSIKLFSISDMGTYKSIGNMHGHTGGITHMQFTPDGTKLVSGARKDNKLLVWDLRYYRRPLNILQRCVRTNQRIYFDISYCGRYLVSGGSDGVISVWDDKHVKWTGQFNANNADKENVTFRFHLYQDSCNSISIHPSRPILATGSGQYHFIDPIKVLDQEGDSTSDDESIQNTIKSPKLDLDNTSTKKPQDNKAGCHSADEKTKDTANGVQVDIQQQSNSSTELGNESTKLNSTRDVQSVAHNQGTRHDSVEAHKIDSSDEAQLRSQLDRTNIKRSIEEHETVSSDRVAEIHEQDICLEPSFKIRVLDSSISTSQSPVVYEKDDKLHLGSSIHASIDEGRKIFSSKETFIISKEDDGEDNNQGCISKENQSVNIAISSEIVKPLNRFQKENEINITETVFEKEILPEQCKIDVNTETHTKLHSPKKLLEFDNIIKRPTNIENEHFSYTENNLTFWWIAKLSD